MASKTTMKIQFPLGGIIPKDVLNSAKDRVCEPGEVVTVPIAYGEHLVSDRFAEKATSTTKPAQSTDGADKKKAELAGLEKAVAAAKEALESAESDEAKATAQAALDGAESALADAKS